MTPNRYKWSTLRSIIRAILLVTITSNRKLVFNLIPSINVLVSASIEYLAAFTLEYNRYLNKLYNCKYYYEKNHKTSIRLHMNHRTAKLLYYKISLSSKLFIKSKFLRIYCARVT